MQPNGGEWWRKRNHSVRASDAAAEKTFDKEGKGSS
jgi:hypothetical protein